ncbi:amidohydrolase family protein [Lactobacillus sp. DCY120]|uniref:Amidohydrolase family protein n=1 Tax=Bombilactobacillus apium TaxID=2675299 RepID=A0A850R955_9LACO|nr:amidohydrolase family protein [Bombilactobacillus apium]NVY97055.1 amidohydrolase family protein [Bombilactobacillus apium]
MTVIKYQNVHVYQHQTQNFTSPTEIVVDTNTGRIIDSATAKVEETVDFAGKYMMPGLMNAHTHITNSPLAWSSKATASQTKSREFCTAAAMQNLQDLLANGVTYIRNVGASYDIDIPLKVMQQQGFITGPHIMTSGRAFTITGGHGADSGREVDGIDEVTKGVRQALKIGVDNIKLMVTGGVLRNGETPDDIQFNAVEVQAAVEEAHHKNKTVAVHAQGGAGVKEAVRCDVDTVEHAFEVDDETIQLMKDHQTFIVPTMNAMYAIYRYGEGTVPDWARQKVIVNIKKHFASITKAAAAGIPIAMGTDAGTPYNGFQTESAYELELYVTKAAMTPAQAIDSATINCARALHVAEDYGSIEVGKKADFLVMAANPVEDIRILQEEKAVYQAGVCVHSCPDQN